MGNLDADFKSEIRRYDQPMILATNRHKATFYPVRMRFLTGGYRAGLVIAQNTTDNLYDAYTDGAASGLGTAKAILHQPVDFGAATGGSQAVPALFRGEVYYDKLVGIDAAGVTDLGGRKVTDARGTNILIF